ncbi:MAG: hypothetical protein QXF41_03245, partial [Candidatus Micrarchaeaceae archaeon]
TTIIQTYTVTFSESGLPSGTSWNVTLNNNKKSSTSSSIVFSSISAGTYSYSVGTPIPGGTDTQYVASPSSGSISVSGTTTQDITYTKQYYLTEQSNEAGATLTPGSGWYNSGTMLTLGAYPNELTTANNQEYYFAYWFESPLIKGAQPISTYNNSLLMDTPWTVTAVYEPTCILNYEYVYTEGSSNSTYCALPSGNWQIIGWGANSGWVGVTAADQLTGTTYASGGYPSGSNECNSSLAYGWAGPTFSTSHDTAILFIVHSGNGCWNGPCCKDWDSVEAAGTIQ